MDIKEVFSQLGLTVLERGWLSSNNIVFGARSGAPVTVVDTGYDSHAAQTLELLAATAGLGGVERILNTHLHSDHCGGNSAVQLRWGSDVWVPEASLDAVSGWLAERLTFELTGQTCRRFSAKQGLTDGQQVILAGEVWRVVSVGGHDPDAVMLFHAASGVLITADALWESRLAIIFPELEGEPGFAEARAALETVENLSPRVVIPGHGRPFIGVEHALASSRARLDQFEADPSKHLRYAARALTMFRMLEIRRSALGSLVTWLQDTPVFRSIFQAGGDPQSKAEQTVQGLIVDRLLRTDEEGTVSVVESQ